MAKPSLCVVVWDDAQSNSVSSVTIKAIDEVHKPAVMQTLGWLLKEDEGGVSVANERCLDQGDETYRGHTFIPRKMIISVTPFTLARPRVKKVTSEVP